jgi:hypothetical protein
MRLGKEDMDAEPNGEVEHRAYHGSGDGRQRRVEKPHAAQLLDLWRALRKITSWKLFVTFSPYQKLVGLRAGQKHAVVELSPEACLNSAEGFWR